MIQDKRSKQLDEIRCSRENLPVEEFQGYIDDK